ncbi:MAG: leucine-rich repeat protein [Bacteroidales bacterium]|nr:leucine-rich repeat protein [Bacteroidales bacterium]
MRHALRAFFLALPVVLAAVAVSCSKQENINVEPDNNNPNPLERLAFLRINSVSTAGLSKAAIEGTSFPTDEEVSIGLFLEGEGYTDNTYKNVRYTRKAGETVWTPETPIALTDKAATVYAYYPYDAAATDITKIKVASSIDGKDFMWATPVGGVTAAKPAIDLTFHHALALVEITFNIYGYDYGTEMTGITLSGGSATFSASGTLNAKDGTLAPGDAATSDIPFATNNVLALSGGRIVARCLLVPGNTGDDVKNRQEFKVTCTFGGKTLGATLDGDNGVIIRQNTKSTISLNIKNGDSKMEVASVGVEPWKTQVTGNTVMVDGHTVTFNCPTGLTYSIDVDNAATALPCDDTPSDGTRSSCVTFRYDFSGDKYLAYSCGAGCDCNFDKPGKTFTLTGITQDVTVNLSLGDLSFFSYQATAKVEPNDKDAFGVPYNEEGSTFSGGGGRLAFEGPVSAVPANAFSGKTALTGITIPEGVKTIGKYAFDGCGNLKFPAFPSSLTSIGECAFRNAAKKQQFTLDLSGNGNLVAIGKYAFEESAVSSFTSGNATSLGEGAFKKCKSLTSVSIGNVERIDNYTFEECTSLKSVNLTGDKCIPLETDAFKGTDKSKMTVLVKAAEGHRLMIAYNKAANWAAFPLGNIIEPNTVVTLIHYTATERIVLSGTPDFGANTEYIADEGCSRFTNGSGVWYILGKGTAIPTRIPANLLYKENQTNTTLTGVTIPQGISSIGANAFCSCEKLMSVSLPEGLTFIGENAFFGMGKSSTAAKQPLTLPSTLTEIGDRAFTGSNIKSTNLPTALTTVHTEVFKNSTLETLVIENNAHYGWQMFCNCHSLKTLTCRYPEPPYIYYYDGQGSPTGTQLLECHVFGSDDGSGFVQLNSFYVPDRTRYITGSDNYWAQYWRLLVNDDESKIQNL